VLVGFDGGEQARRAALRAAELAGKGRVIVVILIEPSEAIGSGIEDVYACRGAGGRAGPPAQRRLAL
jgi:nucleotide-binding universal stress UspA family protein